MKFKLILVLFVVLCFEFNVTAQEQGFEEQQAEEAFQEQVHQAEANKGMLEDAFFDFIDKGEAKEIQHGDLVAFVELVLDVEDKMPPEHIIEAFSAFAEHLSTVNLDTFLEELVNANLVESLGVPLFHSGKRRTERQALLNTLMGATEKLLAARPDFHHGQPDAIVEHVVSRMRFISTSDQSFARHVADYLIDDIDVLNISSVDSAIEKLLAFEPFLSEVELVFLKSVLESMGTSRAVVLVEPVRQVRIDRKIHRMRDPFDSGIISQIEQMHAELLVERERAPRQHLPRLFSAIEELLQEAIPKVDASAVLVNGEVLRGEKGAPYFSQRILIWAQYIREVNNLLEGASRTEAKDILEIISELKNEVSLKYSTVGGLAIAKLDRAGASPERQAMMHDFFSTWKAAALKLMQSQRAWAEVFLQGKSIQQKVLDSKRKKDLKRLHKRFETSRAEKVFGSVRKLFYPKKIYPHWYLSRWQVIEALHQQKTSELKDTFPTLEERIAEARFQTQEPLDFFERSTAQLSEVLKMLVDDIPGPCEDLLG